jgi:hypothetical protein
MSETTGVIGRLRLPSDCRFRFQIEAYASSAMVRPDARLLVSYHMDEASRDRAVARLKARRDIGRIVVTEMLDEGYDEA